LERAGINTRLLIEATIASTEDPEKVLKAAENLVGEAPHLVDARVNQVRITSDGPKSLSLLHDQLRDRHVRSAARKLLLSGRRNKTSTTLMVNRQAAFQGIVVLCGSEAESPLGPIFMTVRSNNLDSVIEWLTAFSPSSSAPASH
jgi:predicted RNA binding protein with dsRBD fold (UPF0201 family)